MFARSTVMGIPEPLIAERATSTALTLFLYKPINRQRGGPCGNNIHMTTDGYHLYRVKFVYRQKDYSCEFYSTAEITPETDKLIAWSIADDAIKECMTTIPDRIKDVYPHAIVISGEFGHLTIKE